MAGNRAETDGSKAGRSGLRDDSAQRESLDLFAQGDTAAFAQVVRQHQTMVFSLAIHFLEDAWTAEDVAQEVFLQLYQNRGKIKSGDHLRFWLRKVTCHRALDCGRRRARDQTVALEDVPEAAASDPQDDPLMRDRLWRLVRTLPEKARMALILRYQEDLSYQEIAQIMGTPVNTVKTSLERGVALLRQKLERSTEGVRP